MIRTPVERLLLVRHPKPAVVPGTCYGSTDVDVDPQDAQALLARLVDTLPRGAPLASSPLHRCAGLAHALAARGWPVPRLDPRLAEMHFGEWEGRPWDDIPRAQVDAWSADVAGYVPPGGESVEALAERATRALRELVAAVETEGAARDGSLIVITHAGVIQTTTRTLAGEPLAGFASTRVQYGELVVLRRAGERYVREAPPGSSTAGRSMAP